ncbi:MAG: TonB-dependent receptor [Pseudomonadales bacterium]|nr:TonB-dependent receptor [Pseudomonadales bacterium]MCP5195069.1 TonB-dependent receptor [Pseudomonadales bacterium]
MNDISRKQLADRLVMALAITASGAMSTHAEEGRPMQLEETVVTAQKREESLQDTPIAISVFNARSIEQLGITEIQDISLYTPNMLGAVQPASSATANFVIRGITEAEPIMSVDPAVGIYMNGVYMARNNGLAFEVVDVERIEVLRGPQGTLYGRNSTGGAVNVITARPLGEFAARQKISVGDRSLFKSHTTINTPEVAGLSAAVSYLHNEQDGYVDNRTTKEQSLTGDFDDFGAQDSDAVNLALRWDATEDFFADYNFDYTDAHDMPTAFQLTQVTPSFVPGPNPNPSPVSIPGLGQVDTWPLYPGSNDMGFGDGVLAGTYAAFGGNLAAPLCSLDPGCVEFANAPNDAFGGGTPSMVFMGGMNPAYEAGEANMDANNRVNGLAMPYQAREDLTIYGHSLTLSWDLSERLQMKSISAYRKLKSVQYTDLNGGGFNDQRDVGGGIVALYANGRNDKKQDQFSQEVQFVGSLPRLEYVAGLYYFEEKAHESTEETVAPLLGFFSPEKAYTARNSSEAVFGQATWNPDVLEDRLRVTLGLRYTADHRKLDLADNPEEKASFSQDYGNTSGGLTLDYDFTDEVNGYAKYSRGYKSGGFMARTSIANQKPFDEETVNAYELGLKSQFWDNRVRLNAAIFLNEFDDLQLSQFEPTNSGAESVVNNAGSASIYGLEIDAVALLGEGLTLNFSYGYLDPDYDEYQFSSPATGYQPVDVSDVAHFQMVSEQNGTVGVQYDFAPFSFGELTLYADASYNSGYKHGTLDTAFDKYTKADAFTLVNARATLSNIAVTDRTRLKVALWSKNLTDEEYRTYGIAAFEQLGFAGATFNEPRSYGLDIVFYFE